jgi:hypothetical protein
MLQGFCYNVSIQLRHLSASRYGSSLLLCLLAAGGMCKVHAQEPGADSKTRADAPRAVQCLPGGDGYLRARLSGSVRTELQWGNTGTECTGAVRPTDGGIRMRFTRADEPVGRLVLVFGIAALAEGRAARNVPVNVTLIREGQAEFYSTQGDDKCALDQVSQEPIVGIPRKLRSYRVVARGFCTQPARAVHGEGAVMMSRFDLAGRVDFGGDEPAEDEAPAPQMHPRTRSANR